MSEIELGDKVKDTITGFKGIATAKTEFINGCVQYNVTGKVGKDNKLSDDSIMSIDQETLEVIKPKVKKIKRSDTGGPTRPGMKMRGY